MQKGLIQTLKVKKICPSILLNMNILFHYFNFFSFFQRGFGQFIPEGVPTKVKLLPEVLKEYGYSTHMLGKWHLGFCHKKYTPEYRGFDTFVGNGKQRFILIPMSNISSNLFYGND